MNDKPMTPEDYLRENPTHMLVENELDGNTYAEYVKDKKRVCSGALQINWTGYTEPHVMIGPEFPQSRKRVVEPEPELSRFLPDGWNWVKETSGEWNPVNGTSTLWVSWSVYDWNKSGLLHPSEGGGFQKHTPGDPMPCDGELEIDALLECQEIETFTAKDFYWTPQGLGTSIIGWRPHYKEQI